MLVDKAKRDLQGQNVAYLGGSERGNDGRPHGSSASLQGQKGRRARFRARDRSPRFKPKAAAKKMIRPGWRWNKSSEAPSLSPRRPSLRWGLFLDRPDLS
jgi:hypothetical protein